MCDSKVNVYHNMREKGISLPPPSAPAGLYSLGIVTSGKLLFSSGKGWTEKGTPPVRGRLGVALGIEQGKEAARKSMLCLLANIEQVIGDLNRIKRVVKITGYISSSEEFHDQTKVLDGASQVLIDVFGENAERCARSAVGVNALPMDMPVEIEAVLELI